MLFRSAHLQQSHIFSYPSIWKECNSRALIEAMSAGLLCVHPNLAGLSDTSGNLTMMYQFIDDPNLHANYFYQALDGAIRLVHNDHTHSYLKYVKGYADTRFNVDKIVMQWKSMLEQLLQQYHDPKTRFLPSGGFFNYKIGRAHV